MSAGLWTVLASIPWFAWIPIVAIIGGTISATMKGCHTHRERMEMIRQGMHPDGTKYPTPEV